jgi:hypothetical protein
MLEQLPELPAIAPNERVLILPSWCDPGCSVSISQVQINDVTLVGGAIRLLLPNNPRRWALGFQDSQLTPSGALVGVTNRPDVFGDTISVLLRNNWYTTFVYGPMIQMEWYGFSTPGGTVRIYELELH